MNEEKIPKIYAAVCGVMEDVGAVGKGDYNKSQGFKYRSIDAVMNALNPAMIKHRIFCVPEVLEQRREERTTSKGGTLIYSVCRMRYRFFAIDGSYVDAVVVGEGMDSGDKATNKAMAVAFKYACFQTFCIPTENLMDDPDADTPETGRKGAAEGKKDSWGGQKQAGPEMEKLLGELNGELARTGYTHKAVMNTYKAEDIRQMTKLQLKDCISKLKKVPDRRAAG